MVGDGFSRFLSPSSTLAEKRSGNMLLAVPSVQHLTWPAASGCRSGQRGGFFLEAAVNPGGVSGGSWLRLRQRLRLAGAAATNQAISPTPAATSSGDEEFTEVVVVRHGETSWNASRIVQGHMDPELNQIGREQALVLVLHKALRERHMGYLQGLEWDDAVKKNPDVFRGADIFKITEGSDPDSRNQELPGGGESLNQLNERCVSYLNKIAREHTGERVVVVSHGAAILELCRHTDPPNSSIRRKIPNTSLNVFRVSTVTGQWILKSCGDVSHLDGNDFLENSFGGDGASA
ncbi:phosphoglycerate mutase-like protein 4 isoform X4 [Panicum virgatum]|uniref:phosphoglycerate mutase-like protein 4 isoform X4 n=1 Tax=Panicum virgatum TaxID=38727 RepID=UPI0019D5B09F|nr:phosphoglycerate mutase-like protein 4 isoform X4 [Panicum virgatum]